LPEYDYSQQGAYFLTICCHEKYRLLGTIAEDAVHLSAAGKIVDECWRQILIHFPNVEAPSFTVMPNHVHGIVVVRRRSAPDARTRVNESTGVSRRLGAHPSGSIPVIVRSFKSITTRQIRESLRDSNVVVWQRGYYERVIRDEKEFWDTCEYIRMNPANWATDEENS